MPILEENQANDIANEIATKESVKITKDRFLDFCRLTANVYPKGKDNNNKLSDSPENWKRLTLKLNGVTIGDFYDFADLYKTTLDKNGDKIGLVCRLGFNPTTKISEHKTKLKTSA